MSSVQVIKAEGRQVRAACARCGAPFSQPYGAVTSAICDACRVAVADECQAAGDTPDAVSRMLRMIFEGQ